MKRLITAALVAAILPAPPSLATEISDARATFNEQLSHPQVSINNGITYWFELDRGGKQKAVNSKIEFHSGDKLRLHLKSNFNGYAYVLLAQSSKGDRCVLFPAGQLLNNRLCAGKEIALPVANAGNKAWLKFDATPGNETLRVVVSRTPIDPTTALDQEADVVIATNGVEDKVADGTNLYIQPRSLVVVNDNPHNALSVDIALNHQP